MAFVDLYSALTGMTAGVSPRLAQKWINYAWRDLVNAREWSFLIAEGGFDAPLLIDAGTVTVTQNSPSVVADVTAAAALNAVVAAVPILTARQFRVGQGGSIYNITAWNNGTRTLTLDRPFLEPSDTTAGYSVYQCYFPPPPQALQASGLYDFARYLTVVDPINGFPLSTETQMAWLDWRDPQRNVTDLAYGIFDYKVDSLGNQLYEFWPHPVSGQTYRGIYRKLGLSFTTGAQALPQMIPEGLILNCALFKYLYPWAMLQAARTPGLRQVNWGAMIAQAETMYKTDLQAAKLQDENLHLTAIVGPQADQGPGGPIDAAFIQSHDTSFFFSRRS